MIARTDDHRGRTSRFAILDARARQLGHAALVDLHVADDPRLVETQVLQVGAEGLGRREGLDPALDVAHHAELLEDAHDFVVERDRARLRVDVAGAVADVSPQTRLPEQARGNGPGRTEAYDRNVVRRIHVK